MTDHTEDRPMETDRDDALKDGRPSGWAGVPDALEDTDSSLDDETPGSQGEIESGSEGDFGDFEEPKR